LALKQIRSRVWRGKRSSTQRRRRGIFVEPQPKHNSSPVGATYSDDVAPTELLFIFELLIYKDVSPTGFETNPFPPSSKILAKFTAKSSRDNTAG
jgi:hypothetical protein